MIENTELIGQCANLIKQEIQRRLDQKIPYNKIGVEVAEFLKPWGLNIKPKALAKRAERMGNATNVASKPKPKPKTTLERIKVLFDRLTSKEKDEFWDWIDVLIDMGGRPEQDTDFSHLSKGFKITSTVLNKAN